MKTSMYPYVLLFVSFTLLAQNNVTLEQSGWQDLHGQQVAVNLSTQYKNTTAACKQNNSPAFNCSGVELRGTDHSSSYFAWNPSPSSVTSGGVSFSYLRADSKYNKLAYSYYNGFFVYPNDNKPDGKIDLDVLCSFPIDAATNSRNDAGCGMYNGQSESKECQLQGITDADGWYDHYVKYNSSHTSQCGFGLTKDYTGVTDAFYQTILSMTKISNESFQTQNEMRIATWQQDIPEQLPIQSFFYTNASGLADAQADQRDFYEQTNGMFVPVIQLTLPASKTDDATFTYDPGAQVETDALSVSNMLAIPPTIETSGDKAVAHLTAKVHASNGEAIAGAMVTWVNMSANGKLAHNITYTDTAGVATNTFTDTKAENAMVYAYGPDGKSHQLRIIPVKDSAAQDLYIDALNVSKTTISADGQDNATITAFVKSKTGGTVAGASVHWTTTLGSLDSAASTTDATGAANATLRSATPGEAVVTATLDNGSEQSTWIDAVN
ncbi:Ig-like domain-containing protein [Pseudescherichia sp.]|uniref:Ig-like domain-containing protein n=1 Tax=Pseudescherichia sp. TaxID=2055881 RepID=UPI00289A05F5|nr:Ig-like domain-containing protein [Pseudescherichia sp.]